MLPGHCHWSLWFVIDLYDTIFKWHHTLFHLTTDRGRRQESPKPIQYCLGVTWPSRGTQQCVGLVAMRCVHGIGLVGMARSVHRKVKRSVADVIWSTRLPVNTDSSGVFGWFVYVLPLPLQRRPWRLCPSSSRPRWCATLAATSFRRGVLARLTTWLSSKRCCRCAANVSSWKTTKSL